MSSVVSFGRIGRSDLHWMPRRTFQSISAGSAATVTPPGAEPPIAMARVKVGFEIPLHYTIDV